MAAVAEAVLTQVRASRCAAWRGVAAGIAPCRNPPRFPRVILSSLLGLGPAQCGAVRRGVAGRAHCDSAAASRFAQAHPRLHTHTVCHRSVRGVGPGKGEVKTWKRIWRMRKQTTKVGAAGLRGRAHRHSQQWNKGQGRCLVPEPWHSPAIARASGSHARQPSCGTTLRVDP